MAELGLAQPQLVFAFFAFSFFFLLSGMILSFLGPYRDFLFWVRFWPEKFFRLFQSKLITLIFILLFSGFFIFFFWGVIFSLFGLYQALFGVDMGSEKFVVSLLL